MEDDRYTRITLRIPRDLHAALDAQADSTSKSLNAEIISRLAQSFEPHAFTQSQRQLMALLADFLKITIDSMPMPAQSAAVLSRRLIRDFAERVAERAATEPDSLMREFSALLVPFLAELAFGEAGGVDGKTVQQRIAETKAMSRGPNGLLGSAHASGRDISGVTTDKTTEHLISEAQLVHRDGWKSESVLDVITKLRQAMRQLGISMQTSKNLSTILEELQRLPLQRPETDISGKIGSPKIESRDDDAQHFGGGSGVVQRKTSKKRLAGGESGRLTLKVPTAEEVEALLKSASDVSVQEQMRTPAVQKAAQKIKSVLQHPSLPFDDKKRLEKALQKLEDLPGLYES